MDLWMSHLSLNSAEQIFLTVQASPPLAKGSPAVAGQVIWARSLFARCRLTMQRVLQLQPDLTTQPLGLQVPSSTNPFFLPQPFPLALPGPPPPQRQLARFYPNLGTQSHEIYS